MRYTVVWDNTPEDELARMWVSGSDRQAIADACDRIDHLLRTSPESV